MPGWRHGFASCRFAVTKTRALRSVLQETACATQLLRLPLKIAVLLDKPYAVS